MAVLISKSVQPLGLDRYNGPLALPLPADSRHIPTSPESYCRHPTPTELARSEPTRMSTERGMKCRYTVRTAVQAPGLMRRP